MIARLEKVEGGLVLELAIYRNAAKAKEGLAALVIELTNEQITELMVLQKVRPVIVDGERVPIDAYA